MTGSADVVSIFPAYERGSPVLHATIYGLPIPQGSLNKSRYSTYYDNAEVLLPWRERLHNEFLRRVLGRPGFPIDEAVWVEVVFTVKKPVAAPKRRRTYPKTKPDTDKLQRAIGDALKSSGALTEDSRIAWWVAGKVFPNEHPLALGTPGAIVYVYPIGVGS